MHVMPFTRSKAKSTHSFPPTVAMWAHLHCSMERWNLPHFFTPSQFVERTYSSTRVTWLSHWHESFLCKEIILSDHKRLSNAAGALLPVYPSWHDLSNSQQVRAPILGSLPRSWLQLEVASSIRVKAVCSWLQSMPRMLVIDITSLILASTSPLIKSLPLFTLMTTVINVPTSTSQRQWRMSPHQLGIAFSS